MDQSPPSPLGGLGGVGDARGIWTMVKTTFIKAFRLKLTPMGSRSVLIVGSRRTQTV